MKVIKSSFEFQWDMGNSGKPTKHGLSLSETEEAFFDYNKVLFADWRHSKTEHRLTLLGKTKKGKLLNITYTLRKDKIRVITARNINKREVILMKKQLNIPKFNDEDEEAEFWSNLDLSKYLEPKDFERVSFPNLKPTSSSISIRIPEYLLNRVKEKANEINIPYQSLIKEYIKKGVFSSQ